jgi:outer membrane protein OmpA-like peptidoglycan-associated protein
MQSPRKWYLLALGLLLCPPAFAGDTLTFEFGDRIRVSERSNLSRTEGGRYVGLTTRQTTAYLTRISGNEYEGTAITFEQTRRNMNQVGRSVDASARAFIVTDHTQTFARSAGVPRYTGLPHLPGTPVVPGDTWSAPGFIVIGEPDLDPPLRVEILVGYRYVGTDMFDGEPVRVIEAQFATRYPPPPDPDDPAPPAPVRTDVTAVRGRHSLTVLLPDDSSAPLFIRDELEEQMELAGRPAVVRRGHVLLFVYGLSAETQQARARQLESDLQADSDVRVDVTATGTRITVGGVRFVADQAVILPEERSRLARIADALTAIDGVRFLVVGHTADVGSIQSQVDLSWERARVMVRELVDLGLDQRLFDVEGRGGREPVDSNETEAGRARNRRVEIYVLEE